MTEPQVIASATALKNLANLLKQVGQAVDGLHPGMFSEEYPQLATSLRDLALIHQVTRGKLASKAM